MSSFSTDSNLGTLLLSGNSAPPAEQQSEVDGFRLPPGRAKEIKREVERNGVNAVLSNRKARAKRFKQIGDHEQAETEKREAMYVEAVFAVKP